MSSDECILAEAVVQCWITEHLNKEQVFGGVFAVSQGCNQFVMRSSKQQWGILFAKYIFSQPHFKVCLEHDSWPKYGQMVSVDNPVNPWHRAICFKRVVYQCSTAYAYALPLHARSLTMTDCVHEIGCIALTKSLKPLYIYISLTYMSFLQSQRRPTWKQPFCSLNTAPLNWSKYPRSHQLKKLPPTTWYCSCVHMPASHAPLIGATVIAQL